MPVKMMRVGVPTRATLKVGVSTAFGGGDGGVFGGCGGGCGVGTAGGYGGGCGGGGE